MLKKLGVLIAVLSSAGAAAAADTGAVPALDFAGQTYTVEAAAIPALAVPPPPPLKEWTVMVFMNAKNNLEKYGISDLNEMETVGSGPKVNIVAQVGRMKGFDASNGDWTGVRRFCITRDADPAIVNSKAVADLGQADMGDVKELEKFVEWAKREYPARRYMLVVWNHGSGWLKGDPAPEKGISYDDETGHNIDTPQLGRALAGMGHIDLLAFDACLMQMAEVAYEIRGAVDYIAASEQTEPNDGYNYREVLGALAAAPAMGAEELGTRTVKAFLAGNLVDKKLISTHSLIRAGKAGELASLMDAFARAAMRSGDKAALVKARKAAQTYDALGNKDLYDFASLAAGKASDPAVKAAAKKLTRFISDDLVVINKKSLWPLNSSNGIAVYLPPVLLEKKAYKELKFAADTQWDEFAEWLSK